MANFGGGAYGATRGLFEKYPQRVLNTPITEAGFVGLAGGAAMVGLRPVIEIMFADFALVAADQLFNQIGKLRHMYGNTTQMPVVVRIRIATGCGYGGQHSMDPVGLFSLFAGWQIVAPSNAFDYIGLFNSAMRSEDPVFNTLYLTGFKAKLNLADASLSMEATSSFGKVSLKAFVDHRTGILFYDLESDLHEDVPVEIAVERYGSRTFSHWYSQINRDASIGLSGTDRSPVIWRPGGGFYSDIIPGGLVEKSHAMGRQVSVLPQSIRVIQSEIENFPYQRLKKAANIVVLEACSHIAAGCTGAAFNVLSMYDEPLDEYEPLVAKLHASRPFFDLMAKSLGRSANTGIHTCWNKNSYATVNLTEGNWVQGGEMMAGEEIYNIGLPASYSRENAQVTVMARNNAYALSNEEVRSILSGGVYMDAETLQQLNDMGFGDLTGFEVEHLKSVDMIEKFTNNTLNGEFAGRERDNRQSFWYSPAYPLRKSNDEAQSLAGLIDYTGKEVASSTMGIYENKLGGRICVAGYYPWTFMESLSKGSQMKSVFRWLSKDSLPGYISSFHRINLWIREPQDGKIALSFTNSSFDAAEDVTLMLLTENKKISLYDMECNKTVIQSSGTDGPYQKFVIPFVDPWQIRLAVC